MLYKTTYHRGTQFATRYYSRQITIRANEINGTEENRTKGNKLDKRLCFNNTQNNP